MKHLPPLPVLAVLALLVWAAFSFPVSITYAGDTAALFPTLIVAYLASIAFLRIRAIQNRRKS